MDGMVEAVHRSASHTLTKPGQPSIQLLAGLGWRTTRIWG